MRRIADKIGYAETITALLVSLFVIAGTVYACISKLNEWDNNSMVIRRIEPIVYKNQTEIALIKNTEQDHQEELVRRLVRIENKIDRQDP